MLVMILSALCACMILVCITLVIFMRQKRRTLKARYGTEIHHLTQALREAEQHQDMLTHQLQQRDQKIENCHDALNELTAENNHQKGELNYFKEHFSTLQKDLLNQRAQLEELLSQNAALEANLTQEKRQSAEKLSLLHTTEEKLQAQFKNQMKALSFDIFQEHNKAFLSMAEKSMHASMEKNRMEMTAALSHKEQSIQNLVHPIQKALTDVDTKIQSLEKERVGAYENLKTQVHALMSTQKDLRSETANLVKALRTPQVRGKWGEMQLRRVVEIAGMSAHCDFMEQATLNTDNTADKTGGLLRPDMIIHLPGDHTILVDAKAPLYAYLEALDITDETEHAVKMADHARYVRQHIKTLSQRAYFEQVEKSPDFVVLFLPGEMFFSAALEQDPDLLEMGFKNKVILATPTTLIALLRAVAYGWRHETLAENAKAISKLGQELSKRIHDLTEHMMRLGKSVGHVVEAYNQTVGTLERRVLVSARRFKELDSQASTIRTLDSVNQTPRTFHLLEDNDEIVKPIADHAA